MTWPLPLYELAIQTAAALRETGHDLALRLVTPEPAPLAAFGARSQAAVAALLEEAGIRFTGSTAVVQVAGGGLREGRGGPPLPEDRVVALPVLDGPALAGVPATDDGFVLVDGLGAVPGLADVFAAGDATRSPAKHLDARAPRPAWSPRRWPSAPGPTCRPSRPSRRCAPRAGGRRPDAGARTPG
jgi:sulfide:quinone oxidoreductase